MDALKATKTCANWSRGIDKIRLTNFRSYASFKLDIDPHPVVITGQNGAGKTNILEAISLFIPGKGLRGARLQDIKKIGKDSTWAVNLSLENDNECLNLGTGNDPDSPDQDRRVVLLDGKKLKSQNELTNHLAIVWATPQMDRLFLDGASHRRKFLDRLVYGFDPSHASRLNRYDHRLRERSALLRSGRFDKTWLDTLEAELSEDAVAITAARMEVVDALNHVSIDNEVFVKSWIELDGALEKAMTDRSALETEDWIRQELLQSRGIDALTGGAQVGSHRSNLNVKHISKNMWAPQCSTGEQKSLLLSLVIASAKLLSIKRQVIPILLLDEVVAHLDENKRSALFQMLLGLNIQTWLTGTESDIFAETKSFAHQIAIEDGKIEKISHP